MLRTFAAEGIPALRHAIAHRTATSPPPLPPGGVHTMRELWLHHLVLDTAVVLGIY